jgi:hypothetical protein
MLFKDGESFRINDAHVPDQGPDAADVAAQAFAVVEVLDFQAAADEVGVDVVFRADDLGGFPGAPVWASAAEAAVHVADAGYIVDWIQV